MIQNSSIAFGEKHNFSFPLIILHLQLKSIFLGVIAE